MSRLLTLHDPAKARRYYADGVWTGDTFYSLLAGHAERQPGAWAVRDGGRRVNWRDLRTRVDQRARDLEASGLAEGDRVSLWLSNRIEAVEIMLACSRNGYVCNPSLHRNYTPVEVNGLLDRIGSVALFIEERPDIGPAETGLLEAGGRRQVFRLPQGRPAIDAGMALQSGPVPAMNPDRVIYLAFTSGTTGIPKGVMHSDNTLLANCRDLVRDWQHDRHSVLLSLSPLSHHIAWVAVGQCVVAGMELVLDDPPGDRSRLDWIIETEATYVMGVPTHAMDILAEQKSRRIGKPGSLTLFYMAGAPIPPATAEAFLSQGIKPQNVYGMTENSSHQYTHPDDDAGTVCATCGTGGAAYRVRIYDTENRDIEVPTGTVGQIGGDGGCLMLGYFDAQAETEACFNRRGDFLSGDLGMLDAQGNLHVVGRLKDMIIRGGRNIYPARIEDLAIAHPEVERAAAFAVADDRLGERVCLAVIAAGGTTPEPDALLESLFRAGLPIYDMPEYFLVLDAFPLTASGKILKRELAAQVRDGTLAPVAIRFVAPDRRHRAGEN